jgi:hypothetical protein
MAKKTQGFNLSEVIREYRKSHGDASAKDALEAIKKAHPSQKINEGTFKSTFYKLASGGKKKVLKRRKPGRVGSGVAGIENQVLAVIRAAKELIALTGDSEAAKAVIDHM